MSIQKRCDKPSKQKDSEVNTIFRRKLGGLLDGPSQNSVYLRVLFHLCGIRVFKLTEENPVRINFIETVFNYRSLADRVSYRLHTQIEVWLKFAVRLICFTVRKAQYLGTLYYTHNFRYTHWQDKDIYKTPNIVCNSLHI